MLGELLTDPPHSLVRQSWAPRRQQHGVVNADGFGIGWYVDGLTEPARHRGAGPIWADETFADLARVVRTARPAGRGPVGHRRHARRAGVPPRRSGPGRWLFSHNGAVDGWPAVAGRLGWGLDPGALATAGGADRLGAALGDDPRPAGPRQDRRRPRWPRWSPGRSRRAAAG